MGDKEAEGMEQRGDLEQREELEENFSDDDFICISLFWEPWYKHLCIDRNWRFICWSVFGVYISCASPKGSLVYLDTQGL